MQTLFTTAQRVLEGYAYGQCAQSPTFPGGGAADAAFSAIGYAHLNMDRAEQVLRCIFSAQQANGLLLEADAERGPLSFPESSRFPSLRTEGPISLPVYGFVLWRLYEIADDKGRAKSFLREMYPQVMQLHRYLYQFRDPLEEGLVSICYASETGCGFASPEMAVAKGHVAVDSGAEDRFARDGAFYPQLAAEGFIGIQDPFFNGLLAWSNECLIRIGSLLGDDVSEAIQWDELTKYAMNEKLWDEARGLYQAYHLEAGQVIPTTGLAGLIPLCGEVPIQEQAEQMLSMLESPAFGGRRTDTFLCPSHPLPASTLQDTNYRSCPVQIKYNWLLYHGLLRYDMQQMAERIRQHSVELLHQYGCFEYYSPYRQLEAAFGNYPCPVAAALGLDFLHIG